MSVHNILGQIKQLTDVLQDDYKSPQVKERAIESIQTLAIGGLALINATNERVKALKALTKESK